jgi:hypothetical protein
MNAPRLGRRPGGTVNEPSNSTPNAPDWIYKDVVPAVGSRVRSMHLLKQSGPRRSVLLFTEEAALVAEKGPMSGVKVYRVEYPRGLMLNESECPHCHERIIEPVGKVARLATERSSSKKSSKAKPKSKSKR